MEATFDQQRGEETIDIVLSCLKPLKELDNVESKPHQRVFGFSPVRNVQFPARS